MSAAIAILRSESCFFGVRDFIWAVVAKVGDLYNRNAKKSRFSWLYFSA